MKIFQASDVVHLIDRKERTYTFELKEGARFQHSGEFLSHDDLIGQPDGTIVTLTRGTRLLAVRPTLSEYVMKMPRGAQIIYPKDIALILLWADIYPGASVLEAGIGSGALTLALLRAVGETGQVVSYEVREDFLRRAEKNIALYLGKPPSNLLTRLKDIYEGIEERELDRIALDLPEPWRVVNSAGETLRPGGILLSYLPTILQSSQLTEALHRDGRFTRIETVETLLRPWHIEGMSVRPDHRMVAHTGFITVARRFLPAPAR
ncbi:MAG TPA: tRNA (adenine-N1)-methyltransferase [Nitrospiria bacterium]|jgi:tRNA (adenine57-N1/adenine58-N1)-methyltransferase|nr:tRNA (adenine-N1)-methyltransferase [Nitrospiria bacterium]